MSESLYTELQWLPRPPEDFAKRCRALREAAGEEAVCERAIGATIIAASPSPVHTVAIRRAPRALAPSRNIVPSSAAATSLATVLPASRAGETGCDVPYLGDGFLPQLPSDSVGAGGGGTGVVGSENSERPPLVGDAFCGFLSRGAGVLDRAPSRQFNFPLAVYRTLRRECNQEIQTASEEKLWRPPGPWGGRRPEGKRLVQANEGA